MTGAMGRTRNSKYAYGRTPGTKFPNFLHKENVPHWRGTAIAAFLVLGCVLRIVRCAQNLPLWSDECFLSVNFIGRGYRELLEPLDYGQIAPPLFLWAQRFMIDLRGFSETSVRMFPLFCGLMSVFLFWHLARRVLGSHSTSLLLATGVFAVSVHPIRHAAEAKPYASDLMAALVLLVLAAEWLRRPQQVRWLLALAAAVPVTLALSNPAVFVGGGIGLAIAYPVCKQKDWRSLVAFSAFAIALILSFSLVYVVVTREQSVGAIDGLRRYWSASFPPLSSASHIAGWMIRAHTGSCFAYPGGGSRGGSAVTLVLFLIGAAVLARRGQEAITASLVAPFGLCLLAASLHCYPYGSEARLMQFVAPSICLLSGHGAALTLAWFRPLKMRRRLLWAGMLGLVACGLVPQVVSSLVPYRMLYDHQSREFARWFWSKQGENAELVCFDLDVSLDRRGTWLGRKAWHLCNRMIYSPNRLRAGHVRDQEVSIDHPLRCVVYDERPEDPLVRDWQAQIERNLVLKEAKSYQVSMTLGEGRSTTENWLVLDYVPRPAGSAEMTSVRQLADRQRR
jgi:hypothetical protein